MPKGAFICKLHSKVSAHEVVMHIRVLVGKVCHVLVEEWQISRKTDLVICEASCNHLPNSVEIK